MRPLSLSSRIVAGVLCVVLGSLIIFSLMVASFTRYEVVERLDNSLQEVEERLEFIVALPDALVENGQQVAHLPDVGLRTLAYQISSVDGRIELRSQNAPDTLFVSKLQNGFQNGFHFRVYVRLSQNGKHYILVGEPTFHRHEAVRRAVLISILPMIVFCPLIWVLVRWIVKRSLRPLSLLQSEIRLRGSGNLSPVPPLDLPEELSAIHAALNLLLDRLKMALSVERSFAANAAHELRNPLGALLAQAQLLHSALGDTVHTTRSLTIVQQVQRLAKMTEKLLQLSRANSGAALTDKNFDLLLVLRILIEEMGIENEVITNWSASDVWEIHGDIDAAAIMLRNVIENALLHGSPGKPIEIKVNQNTVLVCNDCQAIKFENLNEIKKPFVRLNSNTEGTGLGLAIVEMIAVQLGFSVEIISPALNRDRGICVKMTYHDPSYR